MPVCNRPKSRHHPPLKAPSVNSRLQSMVMPQNGPKKEVKVQERRSKKLETRCLLHCKACIPGRPKGYPYALRIAWVLARQEQSAHESISAAYQVATSNTHTLNTSEIWLETMQFHPVHQEVHEFVVHARRI